MSNSASDWTRRQIDAAANVGAQLVLQPACNRNTWTGGVAAVSGMRVRANPAFFEMYPVDTMRWGISIGEGTVLGTCDDNTELRVEWDDGNVGMNIKAGKGCEYWLITSV